MREIEFRGKRKDNNEWLYGQLIKFRSSVGNNYITMIAGGCEWTTDDDWFHLCNTAKVFIETIGQYTGLKDKNGKKIYEGDILQYDGGGIYLVVFDEMMIMCPHDNIEMPSPGYYGILIGDKSKELCPLGVTQILAKVIGNIYDNPKLTDKCGFVKISKFDKKVRNYESN